jgi:hypothetical protein
MVGIGLDRQRCLPVLCSGGMAWLFMPPRIRALKARPKPKTEFQCAHNGNKTEAEHAEQLKRAFA